MDVPKGYTAKDWNDEVLLDWWTAPPVKQSWFDRLLTRMGW